MSEILIDQPIDKLVITEMFHEQYYDSNVWSSTFYLGFPILKCPLDLWIYQELIYKIKPKVIIETGTFFGGSAWYLLNCQLSSGVKDGMIITIDVEQRVTLKHPNITQIIGMSTHPGSVYTCFDIVGKLGGPVIIILDSDHSKENVLAELDLYAKFVTKDSYLIVEDTNLNNNLLHTDEFDGPKEALDEWLPEHTNEFEVDKSCEKFMMTFNPGGYLRRL